MLLAERCHWLSACGEVMVGWTGRWVGGLLLGLLKRATKHRLRKGFNNFKIVPVH